MKILVLIHEYPHVGGGGGKIAKDICEGLAQRGHEIVVVTPHYADLPKVEKKGCLTIYRIFCLRRFAYKATLLDMGMFVISSIIKSCHIFKTWKPNLIHAHFGVPAGAAGCFLSHWSGIPFIITAHLGDVPGGVPEKTKHIFQFIKPVTDQIWENANTVTAISQHTHTLIKQAYPQIQPIVVTNGIDLSNNPAPDIQVHSIPQIVFAGRLVLQKNPLQIVKSLQEIRDLNWKAIIIGDGPLYQQVKQAIERANLQDKIEISGWIEPDAVMDIFCQSDILFMPSIEEGLPIAGLQGLAAGLALVTSTAGSFPDLVIEGVNGNTVRVDQPEGFAKALRNLLADPRKLLNARKASREHARQFDLEKILDRYEDIFQTIVK